MSAFSMVVVYLLIWWVVLFTVLPWGVRGQAEENDIVEGSEPGAPIHSQIKRKFLMTSLISLVLWGIICSIITFKLIDIRDLFWFEVN